MFGEQNLIHPSYIRAGDTLQTKRLPDGTRELLAPLRLDNVYEGRGFDVPKGLVTDFSSIPWFGWWIVRWSRVDVAGVVHDYLYRDAYPDAGQDSYWSLLPGVKRDTTGFMRRLEADWIWYLVAVSGKHHANPIQATLGLIGLRIGGRKAWNAGH